mmetsp:Transcript_5954/g.7252  ORF Transcript_5954/g.7252 Transcript_5954/m.7252 type:complete len:84 (+) Transcript_5954:66-317(+)
MKLVYLSHCYLHLILFLETSFFVKTTSYQTFLEGTFTSEDPFPRTSSTMTLYRFIVYSQYSCKISIDVLQALDVTELSRSYEP